MGALEGHLYADIKAGPTLSSATDDTPNNVPSQTTLQCVNTWKFGTHSSADGVDILGKHLQEWSLLSL